MLPCEPGEKHEGLGGFFRATLEHSGNNSGCLWAFILQKGSSKWCCWLAVHLWQLEELNGFAPLVSDAPALRHGAGRVVRSTEGRGSDSQWSHGRCGGLEWTFTLLGHYGKAALLKELCSRVIHGSFGTAELDARLTWCCWAPHHAVSPWPLRSCCAAGEKGQSG